MELPSINVKMLYDEDERAKRRAKANLDYIIKKYDDKLAQLKSIK